MADDVDTDRLGDRDANPYEFDPALLRKLACTEHTRPHDGRPDGLALPRGDGFTLPLRDPDAVRGTPPNDSDPSGFYAGAPVYYDYRAGERVTYWFFYGGSALPAVVSQRLFDHNRARASGPLESVVVPSSPAAVAEDVAARHALEESHPELLALAAQDEFESFGFGDLWDKLNTFVKAIGDDTYLCHEGDWESVTVLLAPDDEDGEPRGVKFAAHGEKTKPVAWNHVDKDHGRLVVYSALGSHASLPKSGYRWKSGDFGNAQGLRWETWKRLAPVEQDWWGYGGAWGRAGEVGDLTGPLGPSPYKD